MTLDEISKLRKAMKDELKKDRYEHSEGVAYTCASLAMRYAPERVLDALCAGILHDCAKGMGKTEIIEQCKKEGLLFDNDALNTPALLHGRLGAYLAKNTYGINDEEILSAIYFHTIGRPNMSLLEKIVYIADYIEPNRDKIEKERMAFLRNTAFSDLDLCVFYICHDTIAYLKSTGCVIDEHAYEVYTYYETYANNLKEEN